MSPGAISITSVPTVHSVLRTSYVRFGAQTKAWVSPLHNFEIDLVSVWVYFPRWNDEIRLTQAVTTIGTQTDNEVFTLNPDNSVPSTQPS